MFGSRRLQLNDRILIFFVQSGFDSELDFLAILQLLIYGGFYIYLPVATNRFQDIYTVATTVNAVIGCHENKSMSLVSN